MGMVWRLIVHTVIDGVALWFAAFLIDGVHFDGNFVALTLTALLFSLVNLVIRPFVMLLTMPLTVATFGLFLVVVNTLMLLLTSALSRAYSVDGFWPAFVASILITVVSLVLHFVIGDLKSGRAGAADKPLRGGHQRNT